MISATLSQTLRYSLALLAGLVLFLYAGFAAAWSQDTHKRIVMDAIRYMEANPGEHQINRWRTVAAAAGLTLEQVADRLGQGAFDVDDFEDTYLCGAVSGDCQLAPIWGLGASIVKYTSYWHFQNHSRGADRHGNDLGGYDYSRLTVSGTIDNAAAAWLYGDYLDDGKGGLHAWFWRDNSKYDSFGQTERNYRQGSYSTRGMYEDFEKMPFQPIDNLAQYWYSQFTQRPTLQSLGFTLHVTDLLQPHHTWTTSSRNHAGWEGWVSDYYDRENLDDPALVRDALTSFDPVPVGQADLRDLFTQGGAYSYANGGLVLSSTAHADRVAVAKMVIPHAIAMTVRVLDNAALQF